VPRPNSEVSSFAQPARSLLAAALRVCAFSV
jgi:hypothetical protein